ncbi:LeoA/HP0731 family dynamin-like GTPase [Ralstonia insidiosa]|uniref:GTP-binding protein n=1 Tax=Ralstonia insidiosa TaxID=190721 RepID=A0A848NWZ9_9RALS|nr:LeoA/HP0731 family dynamin-like GTPase [Ralstonia insidiosa]NMV37869.1 GTP-binding protein [Ralstonia insidiosa]
MEQFKQFNVEKQAAIEKLRQLQGILDGLGSMGLDVQHDLQKISAAMESIESDVLRIALLGAFSDGKTSVVAAWLGRIMSDMKIDMDESSDRLAVYRPEGLPGECEIVDTPGLFGDKEKAVDGQQVMYEDVTRRYISEAHLILYVVDATNPLKESHSTIAKWVLRDLNKLASTVFVINKMDEVTDLTEQTLFAEQAKIKKDNLKSKLQRAADLSPDELARLNIVCIASNPNGRGLEFWFGKPEHYESRSRINDLKTTTSHILTDNVPAVLIAKTGLDVVRDVVAQKLTLAQSQLSEFALYEQQNQEESKRIQDDINRGESELKRLAGELSNELQAMEKQLLNKLRPLSLKNIRSYLEDELGYTEEGVGYKLSLNIKGAIDRFFEQSSAVTKRISNDIGRHLDKSESFIDAMSDSALKSVGGALKGISSVNPGVIKDTIFAARDVLGQFTGIAIKFKPWEATKLAGNIVKWAGPASGAVSLGADVYKAYKEHELERELQQAKDGIGSVIKSAFKDVYDLLSDDTKMLEFFAPQLHEYARVVDGMRESANLIRTNREKLVYIQKQLSGL